MQPLSQAPPGSGSASVTAANDQGLCIELCRLQLAHLYTAALPVTSKTLQVPKSKKPLSSARRRRKKEPISSPGTNEIGAKNRLGFPGAGEEVRSDCLMGSSFLLR